MCARNIQKKQRFSLEGEKLLSRPPALVDAVKHLVADLSRYVILNHLTDKVSVLLTHYPVP